MMETLLLKCNEIYNSIPQCEENNGRSCPMCCHDDFYGDMVDKYDCIRKLCYYTMNYGPAYASEVYHYLGKSRILENNFSGQRIKVLSLGCGFSPDAYALNKYIWDNGIDLEYEYIGYDISELWEGVREQNRNWVFAVHDLLEGFSLETYDIIFMCKVFSTIFRSDQAKAQQFLRLLTYELRNAREGCMLIYHDINHRDFGRDIFDFAMTDHFSVTNRYYFPLDGVYNRGYIAIENTNIVFPVPGDLVVNPMPSVTKSIVFEYRK